MVLGARLFGRSAPRTSPALSSGGTDPAASPLRIRLNDPVEDGRERGLITCLGPLPDTARDLLSAAGTAVRSRGALPVVLLSELRPDLAVALDLRIDFLPDRHHLAGLSDADYRRYVRRRAELVLAKWDCATRIDLGVPLETFLGGAL